MAVKATGAIVTAAAAILLGAGGYLVYEQATRQPEPPASGGSIEIKPAPALKKVPKRAVAVKAPIEVYGSEAKKMTRLPDDVRADPNKEVLAAAQVQPSLRPQTVTTVIDAETGKSTSYVKADPYPWLAVENRGEIRVMYGVKVRADDFSGSRTVGRLQGSYDVLRVKALTIGAIGSVDTDGEGFIGVGVSYRW